MPTVNGTFYRTHGQGARAENEKKASSADSAALKDAPKDDDGDQDSKAPGSVTAIKDHGDGSYSVKHPDGNISKHGSKDEMMSTLDQQFGGGGGGDEEFPDDSGMDSDYGAEGSSEALKTLLG